MQLICSGDSKFAERNVCSFSSANVAAWRILETCCRSVRGVPLLSILRLMYGHLVLFRPVSQTLLVKAAQEIRAEESDGEDALAQRGLE